MQTPSLRSARDYNRALPAPIRWAHNAAALVSPAITSLSRGRETWAHPLLIAIPLILALLPFDGSIAGFCARHPLSGDPRRELEAVQQYGQAVSSLLVALVIWLQDPPRRRALLDWAAALVGLDVRDLHDAPETVHETLMCLLKTQEDTQRVTREVTERLLGRVA